MLSLIKDIVLNVLILMDKIVNNVEINSIQKIINVNYVVIN